MLLERRIGQILLPDPAIVLGRAGEPEVRPHTASCLGAENHRPACPLATGPADHVLHPRDPRPPPRKVVRVGDEPPDFRNGRGYLATSGNPRHGYMPGSIPGKAPEISYEQQMLEVADRGGETLEALERLLASLRVL